MPVSGIRPDPPTPEGPSDLCTRRFLLAESALPRWASHRPERIVYRSTRSGRWESWLGELGSDRHRRVSSLSRSVEPGVLDPSGRWVWLFEDRAGTEHGRWLIRPFDEEDDSFVSTPDLPGGYAAGLALGEQQAFVGITQEDGSSRVHRLARDRTPVSIHADRRLVRVVGLDPAQRRLCLTRSRPGCDLHRELLVLDDDGNAIAHLDDGPGHDLQPVDWSPRADDARILLLHERADFRRPALWQVETGEVRELDLGIDASGEAAEKREGHDAGFDIEARWLPDGTRLLLVLHAPGGARLEILDLETQTRQRLATPGLPPHAEILDAAVRPDGEIWVEWSTPETPRQPSTIERPLIPPRNPIPPRGARTLALRADSVPLLMHWEGEPPRSRPLVMQLHGGPADHSRPIWSPEVESWCALGFVVLQPDYRGSSGWGRTWREAQRADPAWSELEDLRTTLRWAIEKGLVDPRRTILDGWSWGGYLALLGLGVHPNDWSLGIAEVPMADPIALYSQAMPAIRRMDAAIFGGTPREQPWAIWSRSPMTWAPRIGTPLLLIESSGDARCPPAQIDRFRTRLEGLGGRVESVCLEGGHGPPSSVERRDLFLRRLEFVRRWLPEALSDAPGSDTLRRLSES
jgi:dipeptidyl aminopeptidase/acylaminoacyl peptidase